ncbi:MAG: NADH-quinone oxidoreductase subunit L [Coriobacteriia bacterium]|nr:NADH-quinone oxidoreductase subunit L [Coriobacteriia bacterium]
MAALLAIPGLPLLAFLVLLPAPRTVRDRFLALPVLATAASLVLSLTGAAAVWRDAGAAGAATGAPAGAAEALYRVSWRFAVLDGRPLSLGLALDAVAAVLAVVVAFVALAVQVYSLGYMRRDERRGWFFAVLSLFTAAMLALVLADSFLLLFVAWEVMGLCSYLLIGFWHAEDAPRRAALKAFLTTRVGDAAFMLGLVVMYAQAGSFGFREVFRSAGSWSPGAATLVALLLLAGAIGKSAQVPLHVWLPDAMAGPTPASALIHAATMVAAGGYLMARALPVFEAGGAALAAASVLGALTALAGGLLALVQHDVKKVLAYSTVSQLGHVFVALGAGGLAAGLFHLVTHAFFKSLLFLGAGVAIQAARSQDLREMGGLGRRMPWTATTFAVGALALAGVPPFSGFWSKDGILAVLLAERHYVAFAVALLAAFVTALYVARLWYRVFAGRCRTPEAREGRAGMVAPMVALALVTTFIGVWSAAFAAFLGYEARRPEVALAAVSTAVAVAGLAAGRRAFGPRAKLDTEALKRRAGFAYDALAMRLYFDLAYERAVVRPYAGAATRLALFDRRGIDRVVDAVGTTWGVIAQASRLIDAGVVDGAVNGLATGVKAAGSALRRVQVGRVQTYQRAVVGGLLALMALVLLRGA